VGDFRIQSSGTDGIHKNKNHSQQGWDIRVKGEGCEGKTRTPSGCRKGWAGEGDRERGNRNVFVGLSFWRPNFLKFWW
jgi:hypothetical protein